MNKGAAAGAAAAGGAPTAAAAPVASGYTKEEVAKHNNKKSCWVILHDKVLDVTDFLKDHPGGELAILTFAGKDATEEFDMIHPPDVISKYLPASATLGVVGDGSAAPAAAAAAPAGKAAKKEKWYKGPNASRKAGGLGITVGL